VKYRYKTEPDGQQAGFPGAFYAVKETTTGRYEYITGQRRIYATSSRYNWMWQTVHNILVIVLVAKHHIHYIKQILSSVRKIWTT
jgi:hypothetical protein